MKYVDGKFSTIQGVLASSLYRNTKVGWRHDNNRFPTEVEALKSEDVKANNCLFQEVESIILETIPSKDRSKEIWDLMKKKFQGLTRANRHQLQALRSDFEVHRMKSGESISNYFLRMMAIINRMRTMGKKLKTWL